MTTKAVEAVKLPDKFKGRTVLLKSEIAEILRVGEDKIQAKIESGEWPTVPGLGPRSIRIPAWFVEKLLNSSA